jgi:hypothetical protein
MRYGLLQDAEVLRRRRRHELGDAPAGPLEKLLQLAGREVEKLVPGRRDVPVAQPDRHLSRTTAQRAIPCLIPEVVWVVGGVD